MSASNKKKLRKEQNAIALTEKQTAERAAAKKLKVYTITFIAIMLVVALTALTVMAVKSLNRSGVFHRNTIAATIGDHELNSVMMNYYFGDAVNAQYSEWYEMYGTDMNVFLTITEISDSAPLNKQPYPGTDQTWADKFVDDAIKAACEDYALYDLAKAEGLTLTEEQVSTMESNIFQMQMYYISSGFENFDQYLQYIYGFGSDEESYREYVEVQALAAAYVEKYSAELNYDDATLREREAENYNAYSSFSFASYFVNYNDYRKGGTENEKGNIEYSDEEIRAARAAAKEAAESLEGAATLVEFDKRIAALDSSVSKEKAISTKSVDILHSALDDELQPWIADPERKEGDILVLPVETAIADEDDDESNDILGYNVIFFQSSNDNTDPLANVRHLLVAFEGGSYDEETQVVTYSDEEKAAAKEEAEKLFAQWQEDGATEDGLIALIKEHSDDSSAESGGLYEDIYPNSGYTENFLNWAVAPERKAGDAEIIETEFGYHIMYYVSDSETTYRDFMIINDLRSIDLDAWYKEVTDIPYTKQNTSKLNLDRSLVV